MASAGNPPPNSKRTERGVRRRPSRVNFTQENKGSNDANSGRGALPSRPKVAVQSISPSDHASNSHTASSPVPEKPDDELLKRAKGVIDELYQQYITLDTKYRCFEYYREKVVFYLAEEQKHVYVSRHIKDLNRSRGRGATQAEDEAITRRIRKAKAEIQKVDLEVIEDLRRAHHELVKQKEKGFGVAENSNDKANATAQAFSENILKVVSICPIDKTIDVLSYLNKAVGLLRSLRNTYNGEKVLMLEEEIEKLLKEHKRVQQQQQTANGQASTATTKSTADPDTHHSNVVKLYQRAENMRHQENANSQLRIHRYNLTAKLDRQMEKTERLRRKLEAPADAGIEFIYVIPDIQ
ncbi:hypothetical protein ACEPAF_1184 [Sanghuangporus sanghuang]